MKCAVARQDLIVRIAPSRGRSRPVGPALAIPRGRIRPRRANPDRARDATDRPGPGATMSDEMLLALMA
jgi:hypothetical protein